MSSVKVGFIGTGNMGSALARAVSKTVYPGNIMLADSSHLKAQMLAQELNCTVTDNQALAATANYIFLGVKPQMMGTMLQVIAPILAKRTDRFVLVTMAAGLKISKFSEFLGAEYPIIRIMPNTPASVGEGMIVFSASNSVFMDEITEFCEILKYAGKIDRIDENMIDAASAISGCGPAFVYMFAEALADAGVECGLPRAKAIEYAAQTLKGASSLILTTGKHPGSLKDDVCSPGGTTIAGVHSLESDGFRGAVMNAVKASFDKTSLIGK